MLKLVVLHQCESKGESSVQEWGFSPVWVNMWSLRSPARPHDVLQLIHLCSFSPLWASMWFFRSPAKPNDLLLASFFRVPASLNYLLHLLHLCGFSPVWKSMCLLRFPAWLNDLLQMVHLCGFSPVCVIVCFLRTSAQLNDVSHCSQMCSSLSYGWSYVYPIVLFLSTVNQQVLFQNSSTTKWFETMRTKM